MIHANFLQSRCLWHKVVKEDSSCPFDDSSLRSSSILPDRRHRSYLPFRAHSRKDFLVSMLLARSSAAKVSPSRSGEQASSSFLVRRVARASSVFTGVACVPDFQGCIESYHRSGYPAPIKSQAE